MSGACVFNNHVSLQDIKSHGTWTSDSVWRYLIQDLTTTSSVALAFQSELSISTPAKWGLGFLTFNALHLL